MRIAVEPVERVAARQRDELVRHDERGVVERRVGADARVTPSAHAVEVLVPTASLQTLRLGARPQRAAEKLATMSARCTPASTDRLLLRLGVHRARAAAPCRSRPGTGRSRRGTGSSGDCSGGVHTAHAAALKKPTSAHSHATAGTKRSALMPWTPGPRRRARVPTASEREQRGDPERPAAADPRVADARRDRAELREPRPLPLGGTTAPSGRTSSFLPSRTTLP